MQFTELHTPNTIYERATCPYCFGPLVHLIAGDEIGQHFEYTACDGLCKKEFMPPWPENQWAEPESRPIPTELAIVFDGNEAVDNGNVFVSAAKA